MDAFENFQEDICLVNVAYQPHYVTNSHLAILVVVASSLKEAVQRESCLHPRVFICVLIAAWFLSLMAAAVAVASMHTLESCFGVGTLTVGLVVVGTATGLAERCCRKHADPFAARLVFPLLAGAFRTPGACILHTVEACRCLHAGANLHDLPGQGSPLSTH